jgi:hypothetical protein
MNCEMNFKGAFQYPNARAAKKALKRIQKSEILEQSPSPARSTGPRLATLIAVCLLAHGSVRAEAPRIVWDPGLAFENDRKNYEESLQKMVTAGYEGVTSFLGLSPEGLIIQVYTPKAYLERFGEDRANRTGAHYLSGAIHVNGGKRLNDRFAGLLEHELTHAVIDARSTGGRVPLWLNEGLAERFDWRRRGLTDLAPNQKVELKRAQQSGQLIPLAKSGPLSPFDYLRCYAAVLYLEKCCGPKNLAKLVRAMLDGQSLESSMRSIARSRPDVFEREFAAWVEGL